MVALESLIGTMEPREYDLVKGTREIRHVLFKEWTDYEK